MSKTVMSIQPETIGSFKATTQAAGGATPEVVGACVAPSSDNELSMKWQYTNGALVGSQASLFSRISCTSSPVMAQLTDLARLYRNNANIYSGTYGVCTKCLQVFSNGYHACVGYSACGGSFQMIFFYSLQLPPGYTWTSWGSDCSPLTRLQHFDTLACDGYTGVITIPLN